MHFYVFPPNKSFFTLVSWNNGDLSHFLNLYLLRSEKGISKDELERPPKAGDG